MNKQVYVKRSARVATISDSLPFQLNILASLLFEPVATCAEDAACILEGGDVLVRAREGPPLLAGMVDQRMGVQKHRQSVRLRWRMWSRSRCRSYQTA